MPGYESSQTGVVDATAQDCFEALTDYERISEVAGTGRAARGQSTAVTFRLRIDPGFLVPRRVGAMLEQQVMRRSLDDLRRHVESSLQRA